MLGFVVSVGVLVDTFIVRSMLVPAIITVVGDKSWWPSKLAKTAGTHAASEEEEKEPRRGLAEPALLAEVLQRALDAGGERRRAPAQLGACARP